MIAQRYREANSVADHLAKAGASKKMEGIWINQPPSEIVHLLNENFSGRALMRAVRGVR